MRKPRSAVGSIRYSVSIFFSNTCSKSKADEDLFRSAPNQLKVGKADRLNFDIAMLPEDIGERALDEDELRSRR